MGDPKLYLLLLLASYALAQDAEIGEEASPTCPLAKRFKNFRSYEYRYEAETSYAVTDNIQANNGPKVSCKVEIDVPQTCSFVLRTTECSLSERTVSGDVTPSPMAEAFRAAMEKNVLKVLVEVDNSVTLYPEADEPTNILNVKRGIVSALIVPVLEGKNDNMATIHGVCPTEYTENSREDIATDVTITRDLTACSSFVAQRQITSPLALISGLNFPLSKLIASKQTCNYQFDNQKKHMTSGSCTERHSLLPFDNQGENGVFSTVTQTLTLEGTSKINDRVFEYEESNIKALHMERSEDKAPIQSTEQMMQIFRSLAGDSLGSERAATFHTLVETLRSLTYDTVKPVLEEMLETSTPLTLQALAQCGTEDCTSAALATLRHFNEGSLEVDAATYILGMLSHPTSRMVQDMLEMAKHRQSRPIMFTLSNVVRKHYEAEGRVTPEILAVYDFISSILGEDCAGDKELTFLTLRVVGNMGEAMEAANAEVKGTLLKCMRQPATTLSVQMAAIQAFRKMSVTDEVRSNIQRVAQYAKGAVQKRLAAYLILMKNPQPSDFEMLNKILTQEQNEQVKNFVASHVLNIIRTNIPEMKPLAKELEIYLKDVEIEPQTGIMKYSGNYKVDGVIPEVSFQPGMESNIIFDPSSELPREVMLKTTLRALGNKMDIWEFGMEGKGFESTIEALFGKNGFFPDTIAKAMYWTGDKMPENMIAVLENWGIPVRSEKQVPENLVREIVRNFNKLAKNLRAQESPEAMAYLRILGSELGYIKMNEIRDIVDNAMMYTDVLAKMIPKDMMKQWMSGMDNTITAHYMFMDNEFALPTASGFPLKVALSGTFAPQAKGGLIMSPEMELSFKPSMGVSFVTKMGVSIPNFVQSRMQMNTDIYHESNFNAKISMANNQIKLSIPAPADSTELLSIRSKISSIASGTTTVIPFTVLPTQEYCQAIFRGIAVCGSANADDNKLAIYTKPTGEVTDYTATLTYNLLAEGKEGQQKVDSITVVLKAEGAETIEASAAMKYNRNKNVLTTNIQIPDCDIEAGIRVGMTDTTARGKQMTIDISNHNIPKMSLIARAKMDAMTEGLVQVQLIVPSISTDATLTASMKKDAQLTLEIESDIKVPETSSLQKIAFIYGDESVEIQMKSDMNTEIHNNLPSIIAIRAWLEDLSEDILGQRVKLNDIYHKASEASQIMMDKVAVDVPFLAQLKEKMPELTMPAVPEKLFMQTEGALKYQFNKDTITLTIPIPMGGKSSEELRIPPVVSTPELAVEQIGMMVPSQEFRIPAFSIPSEYDLIVPMFGMAEVSAKINSNIYNWEITASAGNDSAEQPAYIAKYRITADSPMDILSYTTEGSARISDEPLETLKTSLTFSLNHKYLDARINMAESANIRDTVKGSGSYEFEAFSPLGMQSSMKWTVQTSLGSEINGDINMDGSFTVGSIAGSTSLSYTYFVNPAAKESTADSTFKISLPIAQIRNKMKMSANTDLVSFESNTNVNVDPIKHTTKLNVEFKNAEFTVKSDCVTKAAERMLRNQFDMLVSMERASMRFESQVDDKPNRGLAAIIVTVDSNGLEMNADASANFGEHRSAHKGVLVLNNNGLTTSCTTNLQVLALNLENAVQGNIDSTGATMSVSGKGIFQENSAELKIDGKAGPSEMHLNGLFKSDLFDANTRNLVNFHLSGDGLVLSNTMAASYKTLTTDNTHSLKIDQESMKFTSVSENIINEDNFYKHDISFDLQKFILAIAVNNDLKIIGANFNNLAKFNAEPFKMEASGVLKGTFAEEELRHTYEITFADKKASAKCTSNGKLGSAQMTHSSDLEIADLSIKYNGEARFNSPVLRLTGTVATIVVPFSISIDGVLNSDGELNLYGKQTGELFSKFLLKAEPMQLTHSHECRASSSHQMEDLLVETSFQNKIDTLLIPEEQSMTMKMESKVNNHAFNQEITAYNKAERIGMEMSGIVSTNLLNKEGESNQDFAISGFLKYDKNSDSHFIEMPFIGSLPAIMERLTMTLQALTKNTIEMLEEFDSKYNIRYNFEMKTSELKQVIQEFDFEMFVEDCKNFIKDINVDMYMERIREIIPTEEITRVLKSILETIVNFVKSTHIIEQAQKAYTEIDMFVAHLEIEKMVEVTMDHIVELMKEYKVKETIQEAIENLKSIDFTPVVEKYNEVRNKLVEQVSAFDFQQMMVDIKQYIDRIIEDIRSIDFESYIVMARERFTEMARVPCFGKLYGEFKISSPEHTLETTAEFLNSTTTSETPEFSATLTSKLTSAFELLSYNLDATAHIAAPKRSRLSMEESLKMNHMSFSIDHQGSATMYGLTGQASAKTTAKATTEPYTAEFVNNAFLAIESGFSTTLENSYNHKIHMPVANIFSETTMSQKTLAQLEAGVITVTINNEGSGKYAIRDFSDEGTHKSDLEIVVNTENAKINFNGATNTNILKMEQMMEMEAIPISSINMAIRAETVTPFIKNSLIEIKAKALTEEPKLELIASHNTELIGGIEGTIINGIDFEVTPLQMRFSTENKENTKFTLPMMVSGKVDLQNDFGFTINPTEQKASWTGLARFNQYKYSHFITMGNGEKEMHLFTTLNGEANLDMLTVPFDIPAMTVPYIGFTTPSMEGLSLWEDAGLGKILITPQQTFSLDSKLKYMKNPEVMSIDIDMEPMVNAISMNAKMASNMLTASYNQAKEQYEKLDISMPETITIPGFKVPIADFEVSPNTISMPDMSAIPMPSMHMPAVLRKVKLPQVSMPSMQQTLLIPKMGDMTYEISLKTPMLTFLGNADLLNQDNMIARFNGQSSSEFPMLNAKSSGSSTLNMADGLSLSNTFTFEHNNLEGSHTGTITLNNEITEASIANIAKINMPFMTAEIHQELTGNPVEGLNIIMSAPNSGAIGMQMQAKSMKNLNGRLFGRYPTDPQTDVDILGIEMNIVDSDLTIQTSWDMDMPRDMLLAIKEKVPEFTSTSDITTMLNELAESAREIFDKIDQYFLQAGMYLREQGKVMYAKAAETIAAADFPEIYNVILEKATVLLQDIQGFVETRMDDVMTILRETRFQVPGYDERLTIFEIYSEISTFIANFTEDAITRIPQILASFFDIVTEHIRSIEFVIPGTSHKVSGSEILDDVESFLSTIQMRIIDTVKDLSSIKLETIVEKASQLVTIAIERAREFITSLKSQNLDVVYEWINQVYIDFMGSNIVEQMKHAISTAVFNIYKYSQIVNTQLNEIFADFSLEQLNIDFHAWIQSIIERLIKFSNTITDRLVEVTQNSKVRMTVTDNRMEIRVPISFQLA